VDNSQAAADAKWVGTLLESVHRKVQPVVPELLPVLSSFDSTGSGYLSRHDVLCACAALGVVVSESEFASLLPLLKTNTAGQIEYAHLCGIFSS
jgi:Ca2+-binding EF-hand superfamily protein